ncbi:MAG: hypothetical protein HC882_06240 [Acidobacteria bacterium]|nr:hypothetical protein [Acidobacteriota bacterium]
MAYHVSVLPVASVFRVRFFRLPAVARGVCYGALIVFLILRTPAGTGAFIYQQF